MEVSEIFQRAQERGEQPETYDPDQLVIDVEHLLRSRGLNPDAGTRRGMASGAAGSLLRAFGILPAADYSKIDRLNAPDPDER